MLDSYKKELNERISNPIENINSEKGFEIITESLVYKVYDVFGRNSLLSIYIKQEPSRGLLLPTELNKNIIKKNLKSWKL